MDIKKKRVVIVISSDEEDHEDNATALQSRLSASIIQHKPAVLSQSKNGQINHSLNSRSRLCPERSLIMSASTATRKASVLPIQEEGEGSCSSSKHKKVARSGLQPNSSSLWIESCAPNAPNELAVHKAKVQEVEAWLVAAKVGHQKPKRPTGSTDPRLLVMLGPPGTGKSTTGGY